MVGRAVAVQQAKFGLLVAAVAVLTVRSWELPEPRGPSPECMNGTADGLRPRPWVCFMCLASCMCDTPPANVMPLCWSHARGETLCTVMATMRLARSGCRRSQQSAEP